MIRLTCHAHHIQLLVDSTSSLKTDFLKCHKRNSQIIFGAFIGYGHIV